MKAIYTGLIIFIVTIFAPSSVFAARQVPGNLPQLKPLLTVPKGVTPNYSGSVDSSMDKAGDSSLQDKSLNSEPQGKESGELKLQSIDLPKQQSNKKTAALLLAISIILAALVGGVFWYVKRKRHYEK